MILSPLILDVKGLPLSFILSPSARGEATVPLAGEAPALQHILIAFWLRHTDCSNESRLQRCWSLGSRNLGRCLRL
jgi:hypothetical protein